MRYAGGAIVGLKLLQEVIDRSRHSASPFTSQLFGAAELTSTGVLDLIVRRRELTIAVVTAKGQPHAALVVAGTVDGEIYFSASTGSLLLKCLGDGAFVALTCSEANGSGIMMRGKATREGHYRELIDLRTSLDRLEPRGYFLADEWDGFLYHLRPTRVFGELVR